MEDKFVITPKKSDEVPDKYATTTLRLEKTLLEEFDSLAARSHRSRNKVMSMALRYALDHLAFLPDQQDDE